MARRKAEFVGAAGTVLEIIKALSQAVLDSGGSEEDLRRIIREEPLRNRIAGMLVDWSSSRYLVTVDYRRDLGHLAPDGYAGWAGFWSDWTALDGSPVHQENKVVITDVVLVKLELSDDDRDDFDRPRPDTAKVLKQLDRQGLRPANMAELFAFLKEYSDVLEKGPFEGAVALGATRNGDVALFWDKASPDGHGYFDGVRPDDAHWPEHVGFLAVPVEQS
ncbi:MAG: hypothetical protein WD603_00060 [Patescibacteria group bacterium]